MNNLLFNVLIHGTSYEENGKKVKITKSKNSGDSTILFFHIDDNNSIIKQNNPRDKICDLFIYVSNKNKGGNKNNNFNDKKLLILAELKGSDIKHAVEQIKQTHTTLKNMFKNANLNKNIEWNAIIVASGGSIKNPKKYQKEFAKSKIKLILKTNAVELQV
jgi:hypothetical protein